MVTTWTNVTKPSGTSFTTVPKATSPASWNTVAAPSGTAYTDVPKPTNSTTSQVITGGSPIGLLLALTYSVSSSVVTGIWTDVSKATSSAWTNVTKAT